MGKGLFFLLGILPNLCFGMITGNDILQDCDSVINMAENNYRPVSSDVASALGEELDSGLCYGYVQSLLDSEAIASVKNPHMFCTSKQVNLLQIIRIIVKYSKENPEKLDMPANVIIAVALVKAFPCKT